ncbi:MAG: hypothetical protein OHK0012_22390 [Synechococcales cyanobacterium]
MLTFGFAGGGQPTGNGLGHDDSPKLGPVGSLDQRLPDCIDHGRSSGGACCLNRRDKGWDGSYYIEYYITKFPRKQPQNLLMGSMNKIDGWSRGSLSSDNGRIGLLWC